MQLTLHHYNMPYNQPLRGQAERAGYLISLRASDGRVGWGEAAPYPGLSQASLASVGATIEEWQDNPEGLQACPEALHGLRTALLDIEGQRYGQPLCELIGGVANQTVAVSHLVSGPKTAAQALRAGARCLKLKVGAGSLAQDCERIQAVQAIAGPDIQIRVDANRRWDLPTAQEAICMLDELEVDLVEEPTQNPADMAKLRDQGPKIAADETIRTPEDLIRVIDENWADAVVLKPMLIGAPETTVSMARTAAAAGLYVIITTTIDTWVARRTALHIAAAVPAEALLPCGLMTGSWFAQPLAPDPSVHEGCIEVPTGPGLDLGTWSHP